VGSVSTRRGGLKLETKTASRFIKIHIITNKPGNEIHEYYQRVDLIVGFGEVPTEYIAIGACAAVDIPNGDRCYVKESVEEIYNLLNQVDLLP
jgi:hypothetical protein